MHGSERHHYGGKRPLLPSERKGKGATPAAGKGAAGIVKLPAALDAKQMAAMNLTFLTNEISPMTGSALYVHGPAAAKVKAEPGCQRPAKKCKREEEEEEEEDDDDDNMTWACEVAAMRLLKKCKKETLMMLCNDFGIPTSGNNCTTRPTTPTTTTISRLSRPWSSLRVELFARVWLCGSSKAGTRLLRVPRSHSLHGV